MKTTDVHRGSTQVPPDTEQRPQLSDINDSPAGVNNFCITVATINGSGSQTANNCLIRALFRMGIPVSGKNIFPSNIQGLPTWFQIRVSEDGFRDLAARCAVMAPRVCAVLEGGYEIETLPRLVAAALAGFESAP